MRSFGKYRLVEPIACGGMAEVWRAEAPGPEGFVKEVALKLIAGDHDAQSEFVRMFVQEARLASRLAHANVVQVFDFDQVDGRYFLAMELVRGRTLREVVDRCREVGVRFGLARAVHVCAEVARALAYAHALRDGGEPGGLVHRDVSPQNVLLSFEGEVKLTDFGIARALGSAELTAPGTVKGKLAYMAPEQARGDRVDARADVFALGVILWELCAGRRLFARDSDAATLAALVSGDPISPPSAWNEAVPSDLDAVVLAALERDPARRTGSAEELASALARLRLQVASGHEDLDVRALLRRLWPDGAPSCGRRPRDTTSVRAAAASEARTTTAPAPARRRRTLRKPVVGAIIGGAAACVLVVALGSGAPAASARPLALAPAATDAGAPGAYGSPPAPVLPERAASAQRPAETSREPAPATAGATPGLASLAPPAAPAAGRPQAASGAAVASRGPSDAGSGPTRTALLAIRAAPWAYVTIDGKPVGETPVDRSVRARRHRLHASHPTLGEADLVVDLAPGQRFVWRPVLAR